MIISGGENVYSAEVENAISVMPGVAEVAVIGIPDPKWGECVHAIIVPRAGANLTAEAVIPHCSTQIAGYKCPRSVEFRDTSLPLSGAQGAETRIAGALLESWRERGRSACVGWRWSPGGRAGAVIPLMTWRTRSPQAS
jgi:acyl-CoA synthetase (AMP-forming)/AMP-acid ligase II